MMVETNIFFLIEFRLICAKVGRLRFSSLNYFGLKFGHFSFNMRLLDRLGLLLQITNLSSSTILSYLSFFQNFLLRSKKFIANRCGPDWFKRKPFKYLLVKFLLSTMSIFNHSRWFVNMIYSKRCLSIIWSQFWCWNKHFING